MENIVKSELAILGMDDFYKSFEAETEEAEITLFNALSAPDKQLKDYINQDIVLKDVIIERVYVNKNGKADGEKAETPRIILIDMKGVSYNCVSFGVLNSLKRLFDICGKPTWEKGKKVRVIQTPAKNAGNMLGLKLVK